MYKSIFIGIIILSLSSGLVAGEYSNSISMEQGYTLDSCIAIALEQSPEMAMPNMQIDLAKLGVDQAKAQYRPRVGLDLSYGVNITDKGDVTTGDVAGGVFINYDLFGGIYRRENLERAKATLQLALYQKKQSEIALTSAIVKNFYLILKSQHRVQYVQQGVEIAKKNLRQTQLRFDSGQLDSTEITNAQLTLQEAESNKLSADHALEQITLEMLRLMGLDKNTVLTLIPGLINISTLDSLQVYQEYASKNRMDLHIAEENQKVAELSLKYAKLGKLPKINLFTTGNIPISGSSNSSFVLTPNIYWQIYDAGDVHFQIEYAKLNLFSAQTAYQVLKSKVALDIQKVYNGVIETRQAVSLAEHRVQLARDNFRKGEIRYKAGELSEFEYTRLKQDLEHSGLQTTDVQYDLALAYAALQEVSGKDILNRK